MLQWAGEGALLAEQEPRGRLELTWTNKRLRLLAHEDSSYEWTNPGDHRVAEVRLLHETAVVGDVRSAVERARDNLLIRGDALHALRSLIKVPELAREYAGRIKLAYLDPPFNTGQAFEEYDDSIEHSVWLTMMRDRLALVRDLLSPDGSVWLHLDDTEVAYARVLLDEVFGRHCYAGTVIWRASDTSANDAQTFSEDHHTLLVYGREPGWRTNRLDRTASQAAHYKNPDNDPRGPWFDGNPVNSPNPRENLRYDLPTPSGGLIKPPPNGWRWAKDTLLDKIEDGEVRFSTDEKRIIYRTYLHEQKGLPPSSLWADVEETGSTRKAKNELKKTFRMRASDVFARLSRSSCCARSSRWHHGQETSSSTASSAAAPLPRWRTSAGAGGSAWSGPRRP